MVIDVFRDIPALVAIPVRDEAERIADCLHALSRGDGPPPGVLLLINNTTDATVQVVADLAPVLRCPVQVIEHRFIPKSANAGQARRLAMAWADRLAPRDVPLLTTDADGQVAPDWLARNLALLASGLDAVFGRAEIDPAEATRIPPALHQADAAECAYAAALDEMAAIVDPEPCDPWPRHTEQSGASIAVSRVMFRFVGGIPALPLGEDRAFARALRLAGARVRHAPEVRVVVSGRILGRAEGGMADTIRRRLVAPDTLLDDALEPAADHLARLQRRRAARNENDGGRGLPAALDALDGAPLMRRVPVANLPAEMAAARAILDAIRTQAGALTPA